MTFEVSRKLPLFIAAASSLLGMGLAREARAEVPALRLLEEARSTITFPEYSADDRELVARQANMALSELWINRYYKWENHNVHGPEIMGRVLRQARELDTPTFHARMVDVFEQIVDLHTAYTLPKPYACHSSLLPMAFDRVKDAQGNTRVVVSRVYKGPSQMLANTVYGPEIAKIQRGDIVVGYGGRDINSALLELARHGGGANGPAKESQAMSLLGWRWHAQKLLPGSDSMDLRVRHADGREETAHLPWIVLTDNECLAPAAVENPATKVEPVKLLKNSVNAYAKARQAGLARIGERNFDAPEIKIYDHPVEPILHFGHIQNANGTFGYLRIDNFMPEKLQETEAFIRAVGEILIALRDTKGLVIDLRGNPGGNGGIAEGLVQLFTPRPVKDTTLRMLVSPTNKKITELPLWANSPTATALASAYARNQSVTGGFPFLEGFDLNGIGQYYFQPVAILVDPSCYSSCDIFSAHMQDHRAATIWGENGWQTGAGGANVIEYSAFRRWFEASGVPEEQNPFKVLPGNQNMTVGWRQVHRVGLNNGRPVEDRGVQADRMVFRSLADLMAGNENNLFEPITRKLAVDFSNRAGSAFHLASGETVDVIAGHDVELPGVLVNTDRILAFVNGKPFANVAVGVRGQAQRVVTLPFAEQPQSFHRVDLYGILGRDTAWHLVRTVRVRPTDMVVGSEGLSLGFDSMPSGLAIYTSSMVPTSGWQLSGSKLVTNTTPEYADDTTSLANLFVDLSSLSSATLEFDANVNTEQGYDFFFVRAMADGQETMLVEPMSGNLGDQHFSLDLSAFAGKKVELQFVFVSDGGVTAPGVAIDGLELR